MLGAERPAEFFRVTLPNIKWGLLYGVILCNARAMGEFGAVSVVSGHIRGLTNTLPLHVEILYNEYNFQAAFAVASLLGAASRSSRWSLKTIDANANGATHRRLATGVMPWASKSATSASVRRLRRRCKDVSFSVPSGELVALLGPSGAARRRCCGSSPGWSGRSGTVLLDGEDATRRSARDRRVGFVFQHYALFRHMTVFENVAFGLRVRPRATRPVDAGDRREGAASCSSSCSSTSWPTACPSQLSGGQRQRVALARALAVEPKVLLLDEPFGALDANVRRELRRWLRRLHDEIHLTSVFVTHDQEEALELADRVVIINHGVIEQDGTAEDVVERPATAFVRITPFRSLTSIKSRLFDRAHHLGPLTTSADHAFRWLPGHNTKQ